ncbi:Homeobox protein [Schistosoma japonicum]|nr:Homeobox protein [Schistosoma japonicum]
MDLDCVSNSPISDSQSNDNDVECSPTAIGYESTIGTLTAVKHYSVLYDNRSSKIIREDNRNNVESSMNESGYSSYCNYSYISPEEACLAANKGFLNDALNKPDDSEIQYCGNKCQSTYTLSSVSTNSINTTCPNIELACDNNETVSAVASIINHGMNSSSYIPVSSMISTVISLNPIPTVAREFTKSLSYQCDIMSTPDMSKMNIEQINFKSDPDTLWISQSEDHRMPINRRMDHKASDERKVSDSHLKCGNIAGSTTQTFLQPQSSLNDYNMKNDECQQTNNSNIHEMAYNLMNTSHDNTSKEFNCVSTAPDCISSYQDNTQSCESMGPYTNVPSFYSQPTNVYWPWVDKFYAENCSSKLGPVCNPEFRSKELVDYTSSFPSNPSLSQDYNSHSIFINGSNISYIGDKSDEQFQSSKPSAVNLCTGGTISAFHSVEQMSSDYSEASVVTSTIPSIILMNPQSSDEFLTPPTGTHKESQDDENNYNYCENSWQPQLNSVQCSSHKRLTNKHRKVVCVSLPDGNQTKESNISQDEFCTGDRNSSTSFDISRLHPENEACLDESIAGNNQMWQSKINKMGISRLKSKKYSEAINLSRNRPLNQTALSAMEGWYSNHVDNPYPTTAEKEQLAALGGITVMQVSSWFANRRTRTANTKPKKNRRKLYHQIYQLAVEIETITQGALRASDLQERLGQIIDEYLA